MGCGVDFVDGGRNSRVYIIVKRFYSFNICEMKEKFAKFYRGFLAFKMLNYV